MDINIVDYQYRKSVGQSFSHSIDVLHVTHSAKNSETITGDREKKIANSWLARPITIPETTVGHISAPVSCSFLQWWMIDGNSI